MSGKRAGSLLALAFAMAMSAPVQAQVIVGGSGAPLSEVNQSVLDSLGQPLTLSDMFMGRSPAGSAPGAVPRGAVTSEQTGFAAPYSGIASASRKPVKAAKKTPHGRVTVELPGEGKGTGSKADAAKTTKAKPVKATVPADLTTAGNDGTGEEAPTPTVAAAPPAKRTSAPKDTAQKDTVKDMPAAAPVAAAPQPVVPPQPTPAPQPAPQQQAALAPMPTPVIPAPAPASVPAPQPLPSPAAEASAAPKAVVPASLGDGGFSMAFERDAKSLAAGDLSRLNSLATRLVADKSLDLNIASYASGEDDDVGRARRNSLTRALAVRSYLLDQGVNASRIHVQAMGNQSANGNPDRVDVAVLRR